MEEQEKKSPEGQPPEATAVQAPPQKRPSKAPPRRLPPYKVLLHNDDHNEMLYVVHVIRRLTGLTTEAAVERMLEAHTKGIALLLTTHKERAELYVEQFASCGLTVTIEPDAA